MGKIQFFWRINRTRQKRTDSAEFKREVLVMLASGAYTIAGLEREPGIRPGLIKQGKGQADRDGAYVTPGKEPTTAAAARIRELERENARLRQEKEVLKKAMAIFSSRNE